MNQGRYWSKVKPDFDVTNHGTIFLLQANTQAARSWCAEHLPQDVQMFGGAYVVEHRYIKDIVQGALGDGLSVNHVQVP